MPGQRDDFEPDHRDTHLPIAFLDEAMTANTCIVDEIFDLDTLLLDGIADFFGRAVLARSLTRVISVTRWSRSSFPLYNSTLGVFEAHVQLCFARRRVGGLPRNTLAEMVQIRSLHETKLPSAQFLAGQLLEGSPFRSNVG